MKVAYQGETGAYSEMAVYKFFGSKVEPVPCQGFPRSLRNCIKAAAFKQALYQLKQSIEGSVNQNYDLFLDIRPESLW